MKEQNYENHAKIDPKYHRVLTLLALVTLILSITYIVRNIGSELLLSLVILFMLITLILVAAILRLYALKVQDRVIRDEENFRYYRLTGNLLDPTLSTKQVIALRFASDEEFPALVERSMSENLSPDEIKKAVQNWRADHHRV
ncbi:DUF6526 family protein [Pseudalkalibacillus berkeleyi]|uniref:DUF6526 family protein n=1 Tax=Pseudalkalibacillus berkeleyi TaxID=1069813 RepID=A0ABS9H5N7_9BACL|nr:DUF6526 family protein [Pseudalkalibacillus berkeleyi]MCF6139188.1 DUF6526 family protein [Pseudalkalibacillus berkeleyi]